MTATSLPPSRSIHWLTSIALVAFGSLILMAMTIQAFRSQDLVEHSTWQSILQAVSADHVARLQADRGTSLPASGIIRSWYVGPGTDTSQVPPHLRTVPPGYYSSEGDHGHLSTRDSYHALVADAPPGRVITMININDLEDQKNRDSVITALFGVLLALLIAGVIAWLHANLVRPIRELAAHMRLIDPRSRGARIPTNYRHAEIQVIAHASNAHLERVERFVERERSLLDQASHEFRTPIAVIAGAVDVLKQQSLPTPAQAVLERMELAVSDLSETMVALLFLARESEAGSGPEEVSVLHELLPRVVEDHQHLLGQATTALRIGQLDPTIVAAPEAMVRIAVSNLTRNAIENTDTGYVELSLRDGIICVTDSGSGFDPVEAARRYRESLRHGAPARGQGIGLFLIGRICDRFGWKLSIDSTAMGGTRAALDVRASVIEER